MSAPLRAIIADDEPLARAGLRLRLGLVGGVEVVAECASAEAALSALESEEIDVVFVDIHMPGGDGFDLVERITRGALPAIVFVTAFREHALRAFRVGALDYLLKPFDDRSLRATVDRVRSFVNVARSQPGSSLPGPMSEPILVRRDGAVRVVAPDDIDCVEAVGDHVRLRVRGASHQLRSTMAAIEARLDPRLFVRVHRGAIVALRAVRGLQPYSRGEHLVVLADGTTVPLSRRNRRRLLELLKRHGTIK